MTSRRGFLGAMLAAAMAPAFVRAESLMKLAPSGLLVPDEDRPWVDVQAVRLNFIDLYFGDQWARAEMSEIRAAGRGKDFEINRIVLFEGEGFKFPPVDSVKRWRW